MRFEVGNIEGVFLGCREKDKQSFPSQNLITD
jgi:hypothetical protein